MARVTGTASNPHPTPNRLPTAHATPNVTPANATKNISSKTFIPVLVCSFGFT